MGLHVMVQPVRGEVGQQRYPGIPTRGESWAEALWREMRAMDATQKTAWKSLLAFAEVKSGSQPTQKWLQQAGVLLEGVGVADFQTRVIRWFGLVGEQTPRSDSDPIFNHNHPFLKGLVWMCSLLEEAAIVPLLGHLADVCFKKIPNVGPRSLGVGNACLYALSVLPGKEPIAQLTRLQLRIKYPQVLRQINHRLTEAAQRASLAPEDLEEICLPTYGLDEEGYLRQEFGDFTAEAHLEGCHLTEWQWTAPGGRLQKSVPAHVKQSFAEEWKTLKTTADEIDKLLPAQRDRLERMLRSKRSWTLTEWQERFLTHPLLKGMTQRLIWHFRQGERKAAGIWHAGTLVDVFYRPLEWLTEEAEVRLWHPIGCTVERLQAWQDWLEAEEMGQPFKQAHREVYLLTEEERTTEFYSNRYAGQTLRQHQFAALCRQRGWHYRLQGQWDSGNPPTLELPAYDLRVEFGVERTENSPVSEAAVFLYLSTDLVRFYRLMGSEPIALTEIPARIFSEVMRDIDLFVGVSNLLDEENGLGEMDGNNHLSETTESRN